ncbi:MAG TPA: ABC transporter substrate-binding protein [candidate division Zixibacteria bacterium]|nr:ABC transporter substrate-binding protein [candidate division Zixibacteria bacterium]
MTVSLRVLYGYLEGLEGKFAREPSGHLSLETGLFRRHGLEVSWEHVQGTEERYRRVVRGEAEVSLVVGRAALRHFLASRATRLIGCAMNSCPYTLSVSREIESPAELRGRVLACREEIGRAAPVAEALRETAGLQLGTDVTLLLVESDRAACERLLEGRVDAALLPRPYGFFAAENGFRRLAEWPEIVDDPLPIALETTERLWRERSRDLSLFVAAEREGIAYLKNHPDQARSLLMRRFGHSPAVAAETVADYLIWLDENLRVDFQRLGKLVSQVVPHGRESAGRIAAEWVVPGALGA